MCVCVCVCVCARERERERERKRNRCYLDAAAICIGVRNGASATSTREAYSLQASLLSALASCEISFWFGGN